MMNSLKLIAIFAAFAPLACSENDDVVIDAGVSMRFSVDSVQAKMVLPGTTIMLRGVGFIESAAYSAEIVGKIDSVETTLIAEVRYVSHDQLSLTFTPESIQSAPEGPFSGVLHVTMRKGLDTAASESTLISEIYHSIKPSISRLSELVYPASSIEVVGANFIGGSEGSTHFELQGNFVRERDFAELPFSVSNAPASSEVDSARDSLSFIFDPQFVGIEPGTLTARIRAVNEGQNWSREGDWLETSLELLPPSVSGYTDSASRGQRIFFDGNGFLGGKWGGTTSLEVEGELETKAGNSYLSMELYPEWRSGELLEHVMRVTFDNNCESSEFGANAGYFSGTVRPVINFKNSRVQGSEIPFEFRVLPTKQVVQLSFLPAFVDALRLFGLRNFSAEVRDRIVEVVERDYSGINLEVRTSEVADFAEYSIVEIGGADPNGQNLFGLDSTPGFDECNQRLDDNLAGANLDNGGSYGGIFVEPFIQLSPTLSEAPLSIADPKFDEVFSTFITTPAGPNELSGPRAQALLLAIRTLGNVVGNTVSHEIGHSLGLTRVPGCGIYHNEPGDFQIMDCGTDRPFLERAELVEGQEGRPAVWTPENRAYLEMILPLPD